MSEQSGDPRTDPLADRLADPLTGPRPARFADWVATVGEVAARSWQSVLLISLVGVTLPLAAVSFAADVLDTPWLAGIGGPLRLDLLPGAGVATLARSLLVLILLVAASYIASAGWAAGAWAITQEAVTGRRTRVTEAFGYGARRATAVWRWLLLGGFMVTVGLAVFTLPGLYLIYGCSLFGLVAVFEPGSNAIKRSFQLTHNLISVAAGRVLASLVPYAVYLLLSRLLADVTFGTVDWAGSIFGPVPDASMAVLRAMTTLTTTALHAPMIGAIMIGLFVTYTQVRAGEERVTAASLQADLHRDPPAGARGPAAA